MDVLNWSLTFKKAPIYLNYVSEILGLKYQGGGGEDNGQLINLPHNNPERNKASWIMDFFLGKITMKDKFYFSLHLFSISIQATYIGNSLKFGEILIIHCPIPVSLLKICIIVFCFVCVCLILYMHFMWYYYKYCKKY